MRRLSLLVLIIFQFLLNPISGRATTTYTIGATGDYPSIAAAWAAFPATISDDYILEIAGDYVQEPMPINLTAINGASATNTITIRPKAGVTGLSMLTSSTFDIAVFYFDGADYVILDGRPGGVGTGDFTIRHSGSGLHSSLAPEEPSAITFINDATNNIVRYCTLKGEIDGNPSETSNHNIAAQGGVVQFRTGVTSGNSDNLIDNCVITRDVWMPDCLLYSGGTAGAENQNNTVSNCQFSEARFYYARIDDNNNSWDFTGNSFFQNDVDGAANDGTTPHYLYMLYVNDGGDYNITNNYFGGQAANCGGAPFERNNYSIKGIYFDAGVNGTINTIESNTFANWDLFMSLNAGSATDGDMLECIYVGGTSNYSIGSFGNGNVFGTTTGTASITIETNVNGPKRIFEGITHNSSGTSTIAYNTFGDLLVESGGSSTESVMRAIHTTNGSTNINNNTIGHANTSANIVIQNRPSDIGNTHFELITIDCNSPGVIANNTIQSVSNLIPSPSFNVDDFMIGVMGSTVHSVTNNTLGNTTANNMVFADDDDISGIYIGSGNGTKTISGNILQNFYFSNANADIRMIYGENSLNNVTATGNTFRNIDADAADLYLGYYDYKRGSFSSNTASDINSGGMFYFFYGYALGGVTTVSGNTIGSTVSNNITAADATVIYITGDINATGTNGTSGNVTNNIIQEISTVGDITAISLHDRMAASSATGNQIRNITAANFTGIQVDADDYTNDITISDNVIGSPVNNNIALNGNGSSYGIHFISHGTATLSGNKIEEWINTNTGNAARFIGVRATDNLGTLTMFNDTIREIDFATTCIGTITTTAGPAMVGVWLRSTNSLISECAIVDLHATHTGGTGIDIYGAFFKFGSTGTLEKSKIAHCSYAGTANSSAYLYGIVTYSSSSWSFHNNVILWDNDGFLEV